MLDIVGGCFHASESSETSKFERNCIQSIPHCLNCGVVLCDRKHRTHTQTLETSLFLSPLVYQVVAIISHR